ncbi:hypothetical protein NUU61_006987 [Penicillium alfredii]|uniref:Cytochrome oxidase c assembly-domain-containing protein n=1 Tax=Penicillium alfredii TaxID=1506179 RepID=A0A9W9K4S5_9EURO|nr:uncharacterized protein NUU61_006987 [Penicillium alfredii]KAJ5092117.1 hypothetical protein NUU61_006987 [Penicillium alfredii]
MSRSAADATRFTATGPYASSKSGSSPYELPSFMQPKTSNKSRPANTPQPGPGEPAETPRQKVERLRAQARAARRAQETSGFDRFVDTSRRFANKAHKGVVYSLIVASGVCGVLTVYSMISLTLYNRRQRTLWIEKELATLNQAHADYTNGTATPEQLELLKKEKIGGIVKQKREEDKAQRPWAKAKAFLFGKLNTEDSAAAVTQVNPITPTPAADEAGSSQTSVTDAVQAKQAMDAASAKTGASVPGQLDVMAENAERAAKEKSQSWTSWLTGR